MTDIPRSRIGIYAIAMIGSFVAPPICSAIGNFAFGQFQDAFNQGMARMRQPDGSYRPSGPDFNQRIEEARSAYWKQRAVGEVDPEVENNYKLLLAEKDIVLLIISFADSAADESTRRLGGVADPMADSPSPSLKDWLVSQTIRETDHGVRPLAIHAFSQWYDALERRIGKIRPKGDVLTDALTIVPAAGLALQESVAAADPEFLAYLAVRDRAEELAALDELPFDSGQAYLLARIKLETGDAAATDKWYRELEEVIGSPRMGAIADALMGAPKNRDGDFREPAFVDADGEELWLATRERAERAAGNSDPELYAIWQIRRQQDVSWPEAQRVYQTYWVETFGERAVLEAAEKVRTAEKGLRHGKEILLDEIAGRSDPEYALAYSMPHFPYRDKPLGSLRSAEPREYLYALLKDNAEVAHWIDVPDAYRKLAARWGEQTLLGAARQLIAADKDRQGRLLAPASIGARASDPWQALQELLDETTSRPDRYFSALAQAAGWKWSRSSEPEFRDRWAMEEYANLTQAFGEEKVAMVLERVRRATESGADLSTLDGAVSGPTSPLPAVYEILWSISSPEQFLDYLGRLGSFKQIYFPQYGREATLAAVAKILKAPKQLDSLEQVYANRGNVLLVSRESIGLPASANSNSPALSVTDCLPELLRQEAARLAALPLDEGQYLRGRGNGRAAEILRVFEGDQGIQYLVNESGRSYWQTHDGVRRYWEPAESPRFPMRKPPEAAGQENRWPAGSQVRVQVGGRLRDGEVLFCESRAQPTMCAVRYEARRTPSETGGSRLFREQQIRERSNAAVSDAAPDAGAAGSNRFPIGSKVQLSYSSGREICEGTVLDYNERQGWLVEVHRTRGVFRSWFRPNVIQQFDMKLKDAGAAESATPARVDQTFTVGSTVLLEQRGVSIEFTVVEVQGEGRSERVKLEYTAPGARRPSQRWMLASRLQAAMEAR